MYSTLHWPAHKEGGSFGAGGFEDDFAALAQHAAFGDGGAEAHATGFPCNKGFENPGLEVFGDAGALVADSKMTVGDDDRNNLAGARGLDGVSEDIQQRLQTHVPVAPSLAAPFDADFDALGLGLGVLQRCCGVGKPQQIKVAALRLALTRRIEKFPNQFAQALNLAEDNIDGFDAIGVVDALFQQFSIGADSCQGIADLMGNHGRHHTQFSKGLQAPNLGFQVFNSLYLNRWGLGVRKWGVKDKNQIVPRRAQRKTAEGHGGGKGKKPLAKEKYEGRTGFTG